MNPPLRKEFPEALLRGGNMTIVCHSRNPVPNAFGIREVGNPSLKSRKDSGKAGMTVYVSVL